MGRYGTQIPVRKTGGGMEKHTNNNVPKWTKHPTKIIGAAFQREAPPKGHPIVRNEALWKLTRLVRWWNR